jgi:diacylglycerol O-acyltransferase
MDAGFLYMETPTLHMHTLKLAVFEPMPGWEAPSTEALLQGIMHRLHQLPPLRRRLVETPLGFHHPVWIEDPDFDIEYHVRRATVPVPGSGRELDDKVARLASRPLDRRRPLWELYILDGLEQGRLAALVKVHHAVADGVAAAALLENVLSVTPEEPDPERVEHWPVDAVPGTAALLRDAVGDHLGQVRRLPRLVRRTSRNVGALRRHRRETEVSTPLPMIDCPRTLFNAALTPHRSFATTSLPLDEVRALKAARGVTVNDVVLAVVGGALRRYLAARGELPDRALVAGVPVSADDAADIVRLAGNRVSNLFTSLATDLDDPLARLETIPRVTTEAKEAQRLLGPDTLADWVQYTPPLAYSWVVRQYSRHRVADHLRPPINLVVSNVAGPRTPLFVDGVRLRNIYSVGPILEGVGLNITVWSYLDHLDVGVLACREHVPDVHLIAEGLHEALRELTESAQAPV